MMITNVETAWVSLPLPKPRGLSTGPITHSTDAVCRITTAGGLQGIGEARGGPLDEICRIIDTVFRPQLIGQHAAEGARLWRQMHELLLGPNTPLHAWRPRTVLSAIAAVDLALWDIKAKAAGLSFCRLLGSKPKDVPAYISEGFYVAGQSLAEMAQECVAALEQGGYTSLKIRIGKAPADDVARVRAVRQAVGDNINLMVDVNEAWDLEQARATLPRLEEFDLFWLEEPAQLDRPPKDPTAPDRLAGEIAKLTAIPLASGENHISLEECRSLLEHAPLRYMQFDATKNGGVTEFIKVAGHCLANGVLLAPHHAAHFHAHLVAAMPHGFIVEMFDNAKQHSAWPDLFIGYPQLRAGKLHLTDAPGWGMEINDDFINRCATKVSWRA